MHMCDTFTDLHTYLCQTFLFFFPGGTRLECCEGVSHSPQPSSSPSLSLCLSFFLSPYLSPIMEAAAVLAQV